QAAVAAAVGRPKPLLVSVGVADDDVVTSVAENDVVARARGGPEEPLRIADEQVFAGTARENVIPYSIGCINAARVADHDVIATAAKKCVITEAGRVVISVGEDFAHHYV